MRRLTNRFTRVTPAVLVLAVAALAVPAGVWTAAGAGSGTAPAKAHPSWKLPGLRVDGARLLLDGKPVKLRGVAVGDLLGTRKRRCGAGGTRAP